MSEPKAITGKIFAQIQKVMDDIGAIGKTGTNQQQGFKFRSIDEVYNVLHPLFAKHGVFTAPEVIEFTREEKQTRNGGSMTYTVSKIRFRFYSAEDGSFFDVITIGEGADAGDKSATKSMAIAHKYCLTQTFAIPTREEKDPDEQAHEVAGRPQAGKPSPASRSSSAGSANANRGSAPTTPNSSPSSSSSSAGSPATRSTSPAAASQGVAELCQKVIVLAKPFMAKYPGTVFATVLSERYGASETRLMTVAQLTDLIAFMEASTGVKAGVRASQDAPGSKNGVKGGAKPKAGPPPLPKAMYDDLGAAVKESGWTPAQVSDYLMRAFGVEKSTKLDRPRLQSLISVIRSASYDIAAAELGGGE